MFKTLLKHLKALYIKLFPFEYKNNRRYCRKCDQQQDLWATNYHGTNNKHWWQDAGQVKDKNCTCHKHQVDVGFDDIVL